MTRDFGSATLGGYIVVKFKKEHARWGEICHGESLTAELYRLENQKEIKDIKLTRQT
jgi:hypothetical protein